jgi:hypothetical protein
VIWRKALLQSLEVVKPAVATKNWRYRANDAELHFLFTGTHVMAFNGSTAISTPRQTKFTGCIPAVDLTKLLSNSRASIVDLQWNGANHADVLVSLGKLDALLPMRSAAAFPFEMPAIPKRTALIDAQFLAAVAHCIQIKPEKPCRAEEQGITFIRDRSSLYLYSTDAVTISRAALKPGPAVFKQRVILTAEFCQQMLRLAKRARVNRLGLTRDFAILAADDTVLCGRLRKSDNPLNFERILQEYLPPDYAATMVAIPPKLEAMTERIARLVEARGDHVTTRVTCKDGTVRFEAFSNAGEAVDRAKLPGHPDIQVFVRLTLLRRGYAIADKILFGERSVVMAKGDALYLVATRNKKR